MVQESGTTRLSEGLKRPFGAHREPVRTSHLKKKSGRLGPGLKEVGIEYQLQLARPILDPPWVARGYAISIRVG